MTISKRDRIPALSMQYRGGLTDAVQIIKIIAVSVYRHGSMRNKDGDYQ